MISLKLVQYLRVGTSNQYNRVTNEGVDSIDVAKHCGPSCVSIEDDFLSTASIPTITINREANSNNFRVVFSNNQNLILRSSSEQIDTDAGSGFLRIFSRVSANSGSLTAELVEVLLFGG